MNEPSRPFTPGDMPRHLLYGNDYSNRPGSSYKMNNVINQVADEFASSVNNQRGSTQANTNSDSKGSTAADDVLSILERHQSSGNVRPKLISSSNFSTRSSQLKPLLPGQTLPSLDPLQFKKTKSGVI